MGPAVGIMLLAAGTTGAEPPRPSLLTLSRAQPEPPADEARLLPQLAPLDRESDPFGVKGTSRFSFGLRGARDFEQNFDTSLFIQRTWFVVDDVEIGVEAAAWWIFQEDDTNAVSASLITRYHFYQGRSLSAFVEGNVGLFLAGDSVPDNGTSFDLLPRLGAGLTIPLDHEGTRLITGIHWHHISNARINGEARNPSRDAVGFYVGISVAL
jgi:hypothetical protein